jgi:hypothetical protein
MPLWNMGRSTEESATVTCKLGWDDDGLHLGFYERTTHRSYVLTPRPYPFNRDRPIYPSAGTVGAKRANSGQKCFINPTYFSKRRRITIEAAAN